MVLKDKKVSRRDFLRFSALGSAGVLLAACPAPAPQVEVPEVAPPVEDVALLKFQSREPEAAAGVMELWNEFYPRFRDENPSVDVEFLPFPSGADYFEQTVSAIVAGTAADLMEHCCWLSTYFVQIGETLNLQPFIERDAAEVNLDDYYPKQFDPWKDGEDNIHLLPRFTGTMVVYYNKDMFDAEGVPYPPSEWGGWDWQDYTETGKQFVSRETPFRWGTSNYGLNANWLTQYWVRGFGGNMVDPEDPDRCALTEPPAAEALEWMQKIIWDDHMFAYGGETGGLGVMSLFLGERIPMMEMGPWELGNVVEGARFKWDVAPMPDGPAGHTTHQSVDGTLIWRRTDHPEEAWTLLKALTNQEYGRLYAQYATKQPSRISVLPEFVELLRSQNPVYEEVTLEVFTSSLEKGIGGPEEMFSNDKVSKDEILQPAFDQVMLLGQAPVELILRHADIVTRYNRGEIAYEELGAAMAEVAIP